MLRKAYIFLLLLHWNNLLLGQICLHAIDQCRDGVVCSVRLECENESPFVGRTDEKGYFYHKNLVAGCKVTLTAFDPLQFSTSTISTSDTNKHIIAFDNKYKKCDAQRIENGNVALVIANAAELPGNAKSLCMNDARLASSTLKACNFSVIASENESEDDIIAKINLFITKAQNAKYIFVYYSGYCFAHKSTLYLTPRRIGTKDRGRLSLNYINENLDACSLPNSDKMFFLQTYFRPYDCSVNSIINVRTGLDINLYNSSKSYVFIPSISDAGSETSIATTSYMNLLRSETDTLETLEQKYWEVDTSLGRYITNNLSGKQEEIARQKYSHFGRQVRLRYQKSKFTSPIQNNLISQSKKEYDQNREINTNKGRDKRANSTSSIDSNDSIKDQNINIESFGQSPKPIEEWSLYDSSGVNLIESPKQYDEDRLSIRAVKYRIVDFSDTQNVLCQFGALDEGIDQLDVNYQQLQTQQASVLEKYQMKTSMSAFEYSILGDYYFDLLDLTNARKMYEKSISIDTNRYALLGLAQTSYFNHNLQESIRLSKLSISFGNNKAYSFLGELYFATGQNELSRTSLEIALSFGVRYINFQQLSLLSYFYREGVGCEKDASRYIEIQDILNKCYK